MSRTGDGFALVLWGLFALLAGAVVFDPALGRRIIDEVWLIWAGCYGVCR